MRNTKKIIAGTISYDSMFSGVAGLLEEARRTSARAVNSIMTATYWEIGRRIVDYEQRGKSKADYGKQVIDRLAVDLTERFGRGFRRSNLFQIRAFYLTYPNILQTASAKSEAQIVQTVSGQLSLKDVSARFPLPWSHYVRLMSVKNPEGRSFYETEALRCGWSLPQLDRQISTLFYERTALSRNKAAMLKKGEKPRPEDAVTPEEEIKDPLVLEFLGLKDEYSESEMLVVIDLKLGKFTHADAGQMHMYLNYAREHWTHPGENPPVGLILCTGKSHALAHYALEGLPNKVLAAEYKTALPDEKSLVAEIDKTRKALEARRAGG